MSDDGFREFGGARVRRMRPDVLCTLDWPRPVAEEGDEADDGMALSLRVREELGLDVFCEYGKQYHSLDPMWIPPFAGNVRCASRCLLSGDSRSSSSDRFLCFAPARS